MYTNIFSAVQELMMSIDYNMDTIYTRTYVIIIILAYIKKTYH